MKRLMPMLLCAAVSLACSTDGKEELPDEKDLPQEPKRLRAPRAADLDSYTKGLGSGTLMAKIETSLGELNCELYEKQAPLTVANFVGLARGLHPWKNPKSGKIETKPFYDGLICHRIIQGFMMQCGDPLGNGTGGPGYKFATEVSDKLKHDATGVMSMANSGPNTNGSQFFIMDEPATHLDGKYNVFGKCAEKAVIKEITGVPKRGEKPVDDVVIKKVTISRK